MGAIYIVHCVDTEGPLYEGIDALFQRINNTFNLNLHPTEKNLHALQHQKLDLAGKETSVAKMVSGNLLEFNETWDAITNMHQKLNEDSFRFSIKTTDGSPWTFSWFCLDHVGFNGINPRKRSLGDHIVFDKYRQYVSQANFNDEIQWHYHPLPISGNVHNSGTTYLNSSNVTEVLAKKIIDRNWFPSAYRPGFHTERPDSHWFLEQWIPFDFGNQSINDEIDQPDLAGGRYGDWRGAPNDWRIYHPSHDNYKKEGQCRRWIARCLNVESRLRSITIPEIDKAFSRAESGVDTLLSVTSHDFRNMYDETQRLIQKINHVSTKYPDVEVKCTSAIKGIRSVLSLKIDNINAELKLIRNSLDSATLKLKVEKKIFGPQPFLAIQLYDDRYFWENFDLCEIENCWKYTFDENNAHLHLVRKVGVSITSTSGVVEVFVLDLMNYLNDNQYTIEKSIHNA